MAEQSTSRVFMVAPGNFRRNEETAVNNAFQKEVPVPKDLNAVIQREFNALRDVLTQSGVQVEVMPADMVHDAPDAIFPNNWISLHEGNRMVLYPMYAPNRRLERRQDIIERLDPNGEYQQIDLRAEENAGRFLEGTGSMVLDRIGKVAYAALGPRTDRSVLHSWAEQMGYTVMGFHSYQDPVGETLIYHTNVLMSIGTSWAAVCLESIRSEEEREAVRWQLKNSGREILELTYSDIASFGGNILEMRSASGETIIVMSSRSRKEIDPEIVRALEGFGSVIDAAIPTIEDLGGGGVRCMIAEVFS